MRKLFFLSGVLRMPKSSISLIVLAGLLSASVFPAQSVAATTRYEVGIATSATLIWMDEAELEQRLSEIKAMGASWVRVDFNWYTVQPYSPDEFIWDKYDRVVAAATRHNLKILAVVGYTARWAQETYCTQLAGSRSGSARQCQPRDKNEFAHFAATAAVRYRGQAIRAWEIWNEPNLSAYWKTAHQGGLVTVDPQAYAEVANETARRIRDHYPDSVIITGGLAPLFEPSPRKGMRQSEYLANLLPLLEKHYFDGIGIHPYSWPALPGKAADYNAFYTVDGSKKYSLRAVMQQAGWGDKEIWGTEFGASTAGERSSLIHRGGSSRPDHVPENVQAQIVGQGIDLWYEKENVGPLFVHSDSDQWLTNDRRNEGGFGLKREDGSEKPSFRAFADATERITMRLR